MNYRADYQTYKLKDEDACVEHLLQQIDWQAGIADRTFQRAVDLIEKTRERTKKLGTVESFLKQYPLNSEEGRTLMTLAEAYLRVPDSATRNALIKDRLNSADWGSSKGGAADWFTKFAGVGLLASKSTLNSFLGKLGEPFIRKGVETAMKKMGHQFVLGETIQKAIGIAAKNKTEDYSFDMLGEGARTAEDAERYFETYAAAIHAIGTAKLNKPAGISVKLSALHPRYEVAQHDVCVPALAEKLRHLCTLAAEHNIALTVDAEEADRLDMSIEIFDRVMRAIPKEYNKLGLAVQAYQKRAYPLIDHIAVLAEQAGKRIRVRLVKGAYWDTEIKIAQVAGLEDFPVFTRKANTDLSYLACAQKLLEKSAHIYPMFGTHNAHTIAAIIEMAGDEKDYEFQRLHGMAEGLYNAVQEEQDCTITVYAPVGPHKDLLPYLVRRLLENGANSSFINKLYDEATLPSHLVEDPVREVKNASHHRHSKIHLPSSLFKRRLNSAGADLSDFLKIEEISIAIDSLKLKIEQEEIKDTDLSKIDSVFHKAHAAFETWSKTPATNRADILETIAKSFETQKTELIAYLVVEGKKTIHDAEAEVREAIDFCRYYAAEGRTKLNEEGFELPGPTGEKNTISYEPRGTFICISPWNFPLAIFTGQIVAALMAGNSVIAKPAEQTPKIAAKILEIFEHAGLPKQTLQLVFGDGQLGAELVYHDHVAGVAFTGSTEVAQKINMTLAANEGPIVPLIAETGGQNAMIVDSSALPEQVIDDVIHSAFGSTGQRCSALRVLYLQNDIADTVINMLKGAMAELRLGSPQEITTDIGPVIDGEAHNRLVHHKKFLEANGKFIAETPMEEKSGDEFFFAPCAFEIKSLDMLEEGEVFGPILHIIRYNGASIDHIINEINNSGYGLTFGVHTRIDTNWKNIASKIKAGNIYINRGMTGAIVGSQPFGGRDLSGTGPKAGGPNYIKAFTTEKVVSIDTTASGGNATLVSLEE